MANRGRGVVSPTPPGRGTQIEVDRTDGSPVKRYKCSRCAIRYDTVENKAECPLCKQEIKTEQMRQALQAATHKLELLEKQNRDLDSQVHLQSALRSAIDILDEDDRLFLKSVLYQWRQDRSINLKVIHGSNGRPNGFIANPRHGDPEARTCTSIGGLAVAAYYKEALNTVGSAQAMAILLRAAQHLLPGEMA